MINQSVWNKESINIKISIEYLEIVKICIKGIRIIITQDYLEGIID